MISRRAQCRYTARPLAACDVHCVPALSQLFYLSLGGARPAAGGRACCRPARCALWRPSRCCCCCRTGLGGPPTSGTESRQQPLTRCSSCLGPCWHPLAGLDRQQQSCWRRQMQHSTRHVSAPCFHLSLKCSNPSPACMLQFMPHSSRCKQVGVDSEGMQLKSVEAWSWVRARVCATGRQAEWQAGWCLKGAAHWAGVVTLGSSRRAQSTLAGLGELMMGE